MRMDIADLRLFLAIAEAGSITAGAAQANLALASASERLRTIEADAGTALLNRHPRGVSLTEAGAALAHHARLILQQQAQLRGELQAFAHGARGTLHLYANTAALTNYLPSRLAPWLAERPRLHVELLERTSPEVVRAINAGQAEAGIISDAVDAAGLQQHVVAEDPLVMLLPADHRFATRRSLAFAEVAGETFVALAEGNALQTYIEDQARDIGRRLDAHPHEDFRRRVHHGRPRHRRRHRAADHRPTASAQHARRRRSALRCMGTTPPVRLFCRVGAAVTGDAQPAAAPACSRRKSVKCC